MIITREVGSTLGPGTWGNDKDGYQLGGDRIDKQEREGRTGRANT